MIKFILIYSALVAVTLSSPARLDDKRQRELVNVGSQFGIAVDPRNITAEQARLIFKMQSYCNCMCCQESVPMSDTDDSQICDRSHPIELPRDFRCPQTFCLQNLTNICNNWDQSKCDQACFCQRCNATQEERDDYRCRGPQSHLLPGPGCNCDAIEHPVPCGPEPTGLQSLWLATSLLTQRRSVVMCIFSCFCNLCDVNDIAHIIPTARVICARLTTIPSADTCTCPRCPTEESAIRARQQVNAISISQAGHAGRK